MTSPGTAPRPPVAEAADLGVPTTFVLLRHGETALTAQKRFSGSGGGGGVGRGLADPVLSEKGRWQARRVADVLAARGTVEAGVVVTSPLARCRETAETVAARLCARAGSAVGAEAGAEGGTEVGIEVEPGLRETDFGAWEGLTFGEVRERYPAELDAWLASSSAAPPGGESFDDVTARVAAARDALLTRHRGRTLLVVSHVTPIKTLVRLALGAPPQSLFRMDLSAGSLSVIAVYGDGGASVRLLNDTGHLR
jgi:probable phosphoglycerate mutase